MRRFFAFTCRGAAILALVAAPYVPEATAQPATNASKFPDRPIRFVVGFAPGGGNDILARIVGQKLSESLGQPVVIENKPGAAGRVAAEFVARQPNDGYTLLIAPSGTMSIAAAAYPKLSFHPTQTFAPIAPMAVFPSLVLVVPAKHPAGSVAELVAWTKANPDKSNYGSSSPSYTMVTEILKLKTGMLAQQIPYRSSNESLVSVVGEQTLFTISDSPPAIPMVKGGQVKALAVTGAKRLEELPSVPSMDEVGLPDVDISLWSGIFAPAGTAPEIVRKLQSAIANAVRTADVQAKYKTMALETVIATAEQFSTMIDGEIKKYREVVSTANLSFSE